MLLASCNQATSTTTTSQPASTTTTALTTTTSTPVKTTTTTTVTTSPVSTKNWWDPLGKPSYGGTLVVRGVNIVTLDPALEGFNATILSGWMERLFVDNWTQDPSVFNYSITFRPFNYMTGQLATSWEFSDPNTFVVHLRQGVHWQNIAPANGREFVASDVVAHYARWYDPAIGYNKYPPHATSNYLGNLISMTTPDKYTVVFKWSSANPEWVYECLMLSGTSENNIELPEAVAQWGDVNDWRHAIGTGPFILTDYVTASSATLTKNPNYWGNDERYPQNKLPYVDSIKYLMIVDNATALAGLRTGKIDNVDGATLQQSLDMKKTNPEIVQTTIPNSSGACITARVDLAPFSDIRVRKALQIAINLPELAKVYYQGVVDPHPDMLTSQYMTGWGFPYEQWPQDLKDEFTYNPTAAKKLLADAGLPNGFKTNILVDTNFDVDMMTVVKSYYAAVGIDMEIKTLPPANWNAFVGTGHNQDGLAGNYDLGKTTEPLSQIGKFITTNATNIAMLHDPAYDDLLTQARNGTTIDAVKKSVRDANEYLLRKHVPISLLLPMTFSLTQPWLKGYNGQNNALSGGFGASTIGFYGARFWIDLNMKKSLGK
jgi:ABC-type transport system substrate-binding protein